MVSSAWSFPLLEVPSKGRDCLVRENSSSRDRAQSNTFIGKVLNLGADWLLVDARGNARPDTRYNIQTDDGTYIYVQTEGPTLKDGRILLRGKFETSTNGTYAWMNDVVAVGVLNVNGTNQVLIDMWEVNP
jgi:hypothetical protein